MILTLKQYVGPWADSPDWNDARIKNGLRLVGCVNLLIEELEREGVTFKINPKTGTIISGDKYGGFRPKDCTQGASNSSHKDGSGVDLYDPSGVIDATVTDEMLSRHGLYREHPSATEGWCHLTTRPPGSGRRTFYP